MQESLNKNQTPANNMYNSSQTDQSNKNGLNKCPKCGSTDIIQNIATGNLKCVYCRFEFKEKALIDEVAIEDLKGIVIGLGAHHIQEDADSIITLKCAGCGSEVVIDTNSVTHARWH